MQKEKITIKSDLSKKGLVCLWENGGGYSNTGDSQIIADQDGNAKKPIHINRSGSLACENHAMIPINKGDYVIRAEHHRGDFSINIYKVDWFTPIHQICYEDNYSEMHVTTKEEKELCKNMLHRNYYYEGENKKLELISRETVKWYGYYPELNKMFQDENIEYVTLVYNSIGKTLTEYNVTLELQNCFSRGEWDKEVPKFIHNAIDAAKEKALDYHCRVPYYII